jgi:hypothetical protein
MKPTFKKYLRIILIIVATPIAAWILFIIFLTIRTKNDVVEVPGHCVAIVGHGKPSYDIGIRLENHKPGYYINRGEQYGPGVDSLEAWILNKNVTLHVWTNFVGVERGHIEKITSGGEVVWDEGARFGG